MEYKSYNNNYACHIPEISLTGLEDLEVKMGVEVVGMAVVGNANEFDR